MQQQQHLMQMQPMMAAYYPNNVTTDHIQQYLDENKSLILKIVESQNSGKLNECAENQARLQRNLMYLAAIADSQPQPPPSMHSQFPPGGILQAGGSGHYMQQQQQQQQQMNPQSLMAARSSMVYSQQQQALLGMSSVGTSGLHMLQSEANSSGYADFGRAGETMQGSSGLGRGMGMGIGMGNKLEIGSNEGGGRGGGGGGENLYLKSGEDGN